MTEEAPLKENEGKKFASGAETWEVVMQPVYRIYKEEFVKTI